MVCFYLSKIKHLKIYLNTLETTLTVSSSWEKQAGGSLGGKKSYSFLPTFWFTT